MILCTYILHVNKKNDMIAQTFRPELKRSSSLSDRRKIETGFPSPATDHLESRLNLHDYVVKHPVSTFFSQVKGESENALGLRDGDILVIDRSLAPRQNSLVVAEIDGEFRVCRLLNNKGGWFFEKGDGQLISISFEPDFESPIWGRVTHVIHSV